MAVCQTWSSMRDKFYLSPEQKNLGCSAGSQAVSCFKPRAIRAIAEHACNGTETKDNMESYHSEKFKEQDLRAFVHALLMNAGCDEASSSAVARALVDASARGYDTHGVRLLPWYFECLEGGRINRHPSVGIMRRAPGVIHVDADHGFGHLSSFSAIDDLCDIADRQGVAVATVGRSSHHGATGCYTLAAALKGYASLGMTHADALVVPHDGIDRFYGTNPISFAVPLEGEEPLLLDMATSSVPLNRVLLRRATGTPLPHDVAVDAEGEATIDPNSAAALLPLGGATYGYKGAGLAGMVDILCSAFTGMQHGARMPCFNGPDYSTPIEIGHFFIVMQPAVFQTMAAFNASLSAFVGDLRGQRAKAGCKVMAPSDPEKAEARIRRNCGIPVDPVTWKQLRTLAMRYGCLIPVARA
jgi:ureidoglycolate dehydrogenase (NAD+)